MNVKDCFRIGNIYKSHGLKGEVSVYLLPDAPADFSDMETFFLEQKGSLVPYFVEAISIKGNRAYVKFEDIKSKEEADALKGLHLYLPLTLREQLPEGDYYEDQLQGLVVSDQHLGALGRVKSIEQSGLSRLLVIDYKNRDLLIPMNSPLIVSIDINKQTINVNLPEGYLDI